MSDADDAGAAPQGEDGEAQGRAGRRGRREDDREGPPDRPHRPGQGQVDRRLRADPAGARPWLARRRRAVHQGRLVDRRARRAGRASATSSPGTRWARASPGRRRTATATSPPPSAPGQARASMMADPGIRLLVLDELNIALRYDYLPSTRSSRPSPPAGPTSTSSSPAATPSRSSIAAADLVTEMTLVKHHFAAGREGAGGDRVLRGWNTRRPARPRYDAAIRTRDQRLRTQGSPFPSRERLSHAHALHEVTMSTIAPEPCPRALAPSRSLRPRIPSIRAFASAMSTSRWPTSTARSASIAACSAST